MKAASAGNTKMRVVQSVVGAFHHFDLARELYSHGNLERIYSTFPWMRLKRETLPRSVVRTFPLIDPALMLLSRYGIPLPQFIKRQLQYANIVTFDHWVSRRIPTCEAFVAISGCGLVTGQTVKSRGGVYICDRGSSHIRFQDQIMTEEYRRWGSDAQGCDTRAILREEAEYAQADAITVPSEFSRRSFIEMGVPESRVYKIPYGVNLQRFQPVGKPPQDSFEVLFAGQVGFRKGIPYLLQAFEKLSHPRKRLRIVGGLTREIGPFLAKHLPVGVEILGLIPQSELRQIMSSSHVMVLPSIEEGLALVQGQAMACGCPLISSTNTGGSDLFTPGVEGFEVPIRSADAIAERLQQLADEPLLQQKMGQAALERVKTLGGWRDYGEQYLSLLEQLVSASAGV
jgi:glycosyltransferase involved in cell wall biosynthesis